LGDSVEAFDPTEKEGDSRTAVSMLERLTS
jgi:hypothetical protein